MHSFKLSYDVMSHKKVYDADCFVAVPEGKKCFIVVTKEGYMDPVIYNVLDELPSETSATGTWIHGTLFYQEKDRNRKVFCMEDVLLHQGARQDANTFKENMQLLVSILRNMEHLSTKDIMVGLPIMSTRFQHIVQTCATLQYKINRIQYRYFDSADKSVLCAPYFKPKIIHETKREVEYPPANTRECNGKGTIPTPTPTSKEKPYPNGRVFTVKADLQNDIYNLFTTEANAKETFYDIAFVPDYKTSVLMNRLFRNIKENENLDSLQESDDEEEFENDRLDKFVDLTKEIKMVCFLNMKFKRWVPTRVLR